MRQVELMCTDKFSAYNWRALAPLPLLLAACRLQRGGLSRRVFFVGRKRA